MFIGFPNIRRDLATVQARFKRTVAGSANVTVDLAVVLADPTIIVEVASTNAFPAPVIYLSNRIGYLDDGDTTDPAFIGKLSVSGDPINLSPHKLNLLLSVLGSHGLAHVLADAMIYTSVVITPKYTLI